MKALSTVCITFLSVFLISGCATESHRVIDVPKTVNQASQYHGPKSALSVGKFDNRSSFRRGIFSEGVDQLSSQAKTILMTHLHQSNRFNVLDRANLSELSFESGLSGQEQTLKGANFVVTGDVTEFGRRSVGDQQLFGILGRGKEQIAYAKVSLNVINVITSEVVYSSQGAGEYSLSSREIIGTGGTASYDSTLNGKVLDLAIREAVIGLVTGIDQGFWSPVE
ncbi:CsgG/HfaB family protein [Nitrincola sp. MINF-07-Sa-05]|uniref:CsgG/HfaB family protein n=1 Tax=Nitrincola salilacus TaxID=3400273 RepID=UPI0039185927